MTVDSTILSLFANLSPLVATNRQVTSWFQQVGAAITGGLRTIMTDVRALAADLGRNPQDALAVIVPRLQQTVLATLPQIVASLREDWPFGNQMATGGTGASTDTDTQSPAEALSTPTATVMTGLLGQWSHRPIGVMSAPVTDGLGARQLGETSRQGLLAAFS